LSNNTKPELLIAGKIVSAHGVKGFVKVKSYLDNNKRFHEKSAFLLSDSSEIFLIPKFWKKDILVAEIEGVSSRSQAEEDYCGKDIYIDKNELPEIESSDEFYYFDLIGLDAQSPDGKFIGEITNVLNFGAGDIIEILMNESGKKEMFVFSNENFTDVNIDRGFCIFNRPEIENT
jgi:16S rRNA processing protein RimM